MLQAGAQAPPFGVVTIDDGHFDLITALERGPVLLSFVKASCAACQLAFPYMERLWSLYRDRDWSFLVVAQDQPTAFREVVAKRGLTMPVAAEYADYPVSQAYDPEATPTLFWIEPSGRIGRVSFGFAKKDLNELAALVAGKSDFETEDVAPADDGNPSFKPG